MSNEDPALDPPQRKVVNPMLMTEAFWDGYDSDGWEGPPRGTDMDEIEAANEENTLPAANAMELERAPRHVAILEKDLLKMKTADLKH